MQQLSEARPRTASETMWMAGLNETEIMNLVWLKQEIHAGRRSELTPAHKRLMFFRYLREQGRLHD